MGKLKKNIFEDEPKIKKRSGFEDVITKFVERNIDYSKTTENYYGFVIDVYNNKHYGKTCHITILMKKPFTDKDADSLSENVRNIKYLIQDYFSDMFKGGVYTSTSTIDNYLDTNFFYEDKK